MARAGPRASEASPSGRASLAALFSAGSCCCPPSPADSRTSWSVSEDTVAEMSKNTQVAGVLGSTDSTQIDPGPLVKLLVLQYVAIQMASNIIACCSIV